MNPVESNPPADGTAIQTPSHPASEGAGVELTPIPPSVDGTGVQLTPIPPSVDGTGVQLTPAVSGGNLSTAPYQPGSSSSSGSSGVPSYPLRYRAVRSHAKGGLGEVFIATDLELNRDIALKEIRDIHGTHPVLMADFLREAQITGKLEHPGIVPVYGLGVYADGRPYYAMRFIQGEEFLAAINRFHAEKHGFDSLPFRQLLNRFVAACNAIAFAHSKGIIHRDIKPANVMLGSFGETLVVDWGLGKEIRSAELNSELRTSNSELQTEVGTVKGTPAYMAPEQAAGKIDELNAACDIYSLGGMLLTLLTGKVPLTGKLSEIQARLKQGAIPQAIEFRTDVPLALNAVCRKAMSLKPEDRYPSATALAGEIEHWLADEPVEAFPESFIVRAKRWMRKHPGTVAGTAASLFVGIAALVIGLVVIGGKNAELAKANQQEKDANEKAQLRLKQVEEGNEILTAIFTDIDYRNVRAGQQPIEAAIAASLVKAGKRLDGETLGDPMAMALLQNRLALSLLYLGYPRDGIDLFEKARATFKERLGSEHPNTLMSTNSLAACYSALGELTKSIPLFEETWRIQKEKLGPDHPDTLTSMGNLATDYDDAGQLDKAMPLLEESYKLRVAKLGADHPDTLSSMNNFAIGYYALKQYDRAVPLLEETLRRRKAVLGDDHPDTLGTIINLGSCYRQQDQIKKSLAMFEEVVRLQKKKLGPEHPDTLTGMNNLAYTLNLDGKTDLAVPLWEETVRLRKIKLGPDHPETLSVMMFLATAYQTLKQPEKALNLREELYNIKKSKLGLDSTETRETLWSLAIACCRAKQNLRAVGLFADYFVTLRKEPKLSQTTLALKLLDAATELVSIEQFVEAELYLRECLAIREKTQPDVWTTFNTQSLIAGALLGQKKYAEAEPMLLKGYDGLKARETVIPMAAKVRLPEAAQRLVELYTALDKADEAKQWKLEWAKYACEKLAMPGEVK